VIRTRIAVVAFLVLVLLVPSTVSAVGTYASVNWQTVEHPESPDGGPLSISCGMAHTRSDFDGAIYVGDDITFLCNHGTDSETVSKVNSLLAGPSSAPTEICDMTFYTNNGASTVGRIRLNNGTKNGAACTAAHQMAADIEVLHGASQGLEERQFQVTLDFTWVAGNTTNWFDLAKPIAFVANAVPAFFLGPPDTTPDVSQSTPMQWIGDGNGIRPKYSYGNLAPPDECSGLTITIADDDQPFVQGDSVQITVDNSPTNPVASVEVQMFAGLPWQGVMAGQIGQTQTHSVPVVTGSVVYASGFVFRCIRSDGTIGYISYGSGVVASDPNARPCHLARVVWPPYSTVAALGAGDTFTVVVDMTGPWSGDSALQLLEVESVWLNLGPNSSTVDVTTAEGGPFVPGVRHSVVITLPAEFLAGTDLIPWSLELSCRDNRGRIVGYGSFAPRMLGDQLITSAAGGNDGTCYGTVDVSITNPGGWVPGLLRGGWCLFESAFVPSDGQMEGRLDRIVELRSDPPLSWVDSGVSYIGGTSLTFGTWADAGPQCTMVLDVQICPRDWDNYQAVPVALVGVLLFGLWSSLVFAIWRWF
jgi:hypothetical protein